MKIAEEYILPDLGTGRCDEEPGASVSGEREWAKRPMTDCSETATQLFTQRSVHKDAFGYNSRSEVIGSDRFLGTDVNGCRGDCRSCCNWGMGVATAGASAAYAAESAACARFVVWPPKVIACVAAMKADYVIGIMNLNNDYNGCRDSCLSLPTKSEDPCCDQNSE